jgi:hypothetical protein
MDLATLPANVGDVTPRDRLPRRAVRLERFDRTTLSSAVFGSVMTAVLLVGGLVAIPTDQTDRGRTPSGAAATPWNQEPVQTYCAPSIGCVWSKTAERR